MRVVFIISSDLSDMKLSYLSCMDLRVSPVSRWTGVNLPTRYGYRRVLFISINLNLIILHSIF